MAAEKKNATVKIMDDGHKYDETASSSHVEKVVTTTFYWIHFIKFHNQLLLKINDVKRAINIKLT